MSAVSVSPSAPPRDGQFYAVAINTNTTRGVPPRDAKFSNLDISRTNYSMGTVPHDLSVTHLAVTQTLNGVPVGAGVIGHM